MFISFSNCLPEAVEACLKTNHEKGVNCSYRCNAKSIKASFPWELIFAYFSWEAKFMHDKGLGFVNFLILKQGKL